MEKDTKLPNSANPKKLSKQNLPKLSLKKVAEIIGLATLIGGSAVVGGAAGFDFGGKMAHNIHKENMVKYEERQKDMPVINEVITMLRQNTDVDNDTIKEIERRLVLEQPKEEKEMLSILMGILGAVLGVVVSTAAITAIINSLGFGEQQEETKQQG
ncbi:MAG: hypothetical protein LBH47_02660 [Christensenellaceae bacterium]|jgi:hypothetical protein|nr:hypothetical protein [Christensenellaceae bacterium]